PAQGRAQALREAVRSYRGLVWPSRGPALHGGPIAWRRILPFHSRRQFQGQQPRKLPGRLSEMPSLENEQHRRANGCRDEATAVHGHENEGQGENPNKAESAQARRRQAPPARPEATLCEGGPIMSNAPDYGDSREVSMKMLQSAMEAVEGIP